jgi:CarD family transcriptional regulator
MFQVGDLIIYGNTGVCRVADITVPESSNADDGRLYYLLEPLYQNCAIYSPVDHPKVFMRPIITAAQAEKLIRQIPSIEAEAYYNSVLRQLADHYEDYIKTYNCRDLMELTMSIYAKKKISEQQKRKFGAIDERYMKRAEELLFGELAAALGIPKEDVPDYIAGRVSREAEEHKGYA